MVYFPCHSSLKETKDTSCGTLTIILLGAARVYLFMRPPNGSLEENDFTFNFPVNSRLTKSC